MMKMLRKRKHVIRIENYLHSLEVDIINASFNATHEPISDMSRIPGNIENKVNLIKKYQRRLKLLKF